MFMYCVCPLLILMDCASTVVSGLMKFCVMFVVTVYLIVIHGGVSLPPWWCVALLPVEHASHG